MKIAKQASARADAAMAGSQKAVAQLAAMGYMNGGMDPTLQMLTSGNPNLFLSQASTVQQLDDEAGTLGPCGDTFQLAAARPEPLKRSEHADARDDHVGTWVPVEPLSKPTPTRHIAGLRFRKPHRNRLDQPPQRTVLRVLGISSSAR